MPDNGENLEAYVSFKADDKGLTSTIETSLGKINQLSPAAGKAESAINHVWSTKSGATGLNGAIRGVNSELDSVTNHAHHAESGLESFFKKLKHEGGRRSALGETVELLRGGGAVMAVSMIGEALEKSTAKAMELDEAFRQGKIDAVGLAQGIAESLPILGEFVKAGENIGNIGMRHFSKDGLTNKDKDERNEIDAEYANHRFEATEHSQNRLIKDKRSYEHETDSYQDKLVLAKAIPEREHRKVEVDIQYKNDLRGIDESLEDQIETKKVEQRKAIEELNKVYEARPKGNEGQQKADESERYGKQQQIVAQTKRDVGQLEEAAGKAKTALGQMHDKAVSDITGITAEMRKLANATELVGKSELDKYTTGLRQGGLTDGKLIGDLEVAKAKEIGAILHESLMTPMEKYNKENADLRQLKDKEGISQQDYIRAMAKNAHEMLSSVKTNSVQGAFEENIKNRFIANGINGQVDDLNEQAKKKGVADWGQRDPSKPELGQHYLQTDWGFGATADNSPLPATPDDSKKSRVNPWGYMDQKTPSGVLLPPKHMDYSDGSGWGNVKHESDQTVQKPDQQPAEAPQGPKQGNEGQSSLDAMRAAYGVPKPDQTSPQDQLRQLRSSYGLDQPAGETGYKLPEVSALQQPNANPPKDDSAAAPIKDNTKAVADATDQTKTLNDNLTKLNQTLSTGVPAVFA